VRKTERNNCLILFHRESKSHSHIVKYSMKEITECIGRANSTIFSTLDLDPNATDSGATDMVLMTLVLMTLVPIMTLVPVTLVPMILAPMTMVPMTLMEMALVPMT
jgi:hypothetical protein